MNVGIRVDASILIGSGHVMRCLVLAVALRDEGCLVTFVCRPQPGDLIDVIIARKFNVIRLNPIMNDEPIVEATDYVEWLGRSVVDDADDFLFRAKKFDIVVTDHYAIGKEWQKIVRAKLSCKIIAIDDLVREHDADVLIDQTLGRKAQDYHGVERVLSGSDYALIKPIFAELREQAYDRFSRNSTIRILVSMGGVDNSNVTLLVLQKLVTKPDTQITVLLSSRAPHHSKIVSFCSKYDHIQHIDFVEDMAAVMINHDLAIGAPGSTSWERACLGLPSVIIPVAENQYEIAQILQLKRASVVVNLSELDTSFLDAYEKVKAMWSVYVRANLALCDGLGVYRVLAGIKHLLASPSPVYQLMAVNTEDINQIFQWQINPLTRKYALSLGAPSWEDHVKWMNEKMSKVEDYFYKVVHLHRKQSVGVVRLDRMNPGHYLVSIYIDPDNYGCGIAQKSLAILDQIHPHISIHATVVQENKASQRLFEKAGYVREGAEKFIRNPIKRQRNV